MLRSPATDQTGALSSKSPVREKLGRAVLVLALPVLAEQLLHMVVGLTDTYLANHLPDNAQAATAAVGTITYVMWFIGLMVGSIGAGSTALIARAKGAKHRSLANSVTGQSVSTAVLLGVVVGVLGYVFAPQFARLAGLPPQAEQYAVTYLRLLSLAMPFTMLMFIANACLRGAGDTVTPAVVMVTVDVVNLVVSFSLTRGWFGLPELGFNGIAIGTMVAYVTGGTVQAVVLLSGRGGATLHLQRLRPHWHTLRRLLRIGLPAGLEGALAWGANFVVVIVINRIDQTSTMAAAHINAVRIEAISYLPGIAFAVAASALVGQSLGMKNPARAQRCAYLAFAMGGGMMTLCGVLFITLGHYPATWMTTDPEVARLTRDCLFRTGFIQIAFASSLIFSGALRGAGDTLSVMLLNLLSTLGVRLCGVLVVVYYFKGGLLDIWLVLCAELLLRGALVYARFLHGGWKRVDV